MDDVRVRIEKFVLDDLLLGDGSRMPSATESLVESGVIDSMGILELIEFIEQEFGLTVDDSETVPENLDGIERLTKFVEWKTA